MNSWGWVLCLFNRHDWRVVAPFTSQCRRCRTYDLVRRGAVTT